MTSIRERPGLEPAAVRDHFPSLGRQIDGVPVAYLDGPGGTQVPRDCIAAMTAYLERSNANHGGEERREVGGVADDEPLPVEEGVVGQPHLGEHTGGDGRR